jgi:NDP-sugar pyrophosphorylase family protein
VAPLAPIAILAGGLGTRLLDRTRNTPKALVEVAGQPFIFHQLRLLAAHGAVRVVMCVGHLGERIAHEVGDGAGFGLRIDYSFDGPRPIGTAAALRLALPLLDERFHVLYGDAYLRVDYRAVQEVFDASAMPALMTVLHNRGRWGVSNVSYADGKVSRYDKYVEVASMEWIDFGLGVLSKGVLTEIEPTESDLARVYSSLARSNRLAGYEVDERFFEIGTPESLCETEEFLRRSTTTSDDSHQV